MSLKVDRLELEIVINNDQSRKQLRELNDEALQIQKSMKLMVQGSDEYVKASQKLDSVKKQMDSIYDAIGITGLSLNELRKKQQEFNMIVKNLPANSPEYAQYKKTLDEINGRIGELTGKAKGAQGIMAQMLGVAGGVGLWDTVSSGLKRAASAIKDYVTEGIQSAIKLRDSEKELLDRLEGNRDAQRELISLAKERAGTSMYSRLEIEEQEKFLIDQGRTEDQIRKTISAATDLATHTGGTLKEAVEMLDGSMEGKLGKGLAKLDKGFKDLSKEQLYNGAAIDLIAKKYSGIAAEQMDTIEGKLNLQQKAWIRLQRGIGDFVIGTGGVFDGLITGATSLLNTMAKWVEIPISKKLEEEQNRVNYLAASLTDANLTAEARNKLYKELETLAPGVVDGLDKENISYQKLTSNLAAYNDQMVNSIIIQKENEKVDNANEGLAKARMARVEQESYMRKNLTDYVTSLKLKAKKQNETDAAETLAQSKKLTDVLYDTHLNFRQKMEKLDKMYVGPKNQSYQMTLDAENEAQAKVNLQLQAKNKLISDLGINITQVTARVEENAKVEKKALDFTKMTIEELNKIISAGAVMGASEVEKSLARKATAELKHRETSLKDYQKFTDDYNKIMQSARDIEKMNFAEKLSQTETEIKSVNDKYDAEIKKIKEFMTARENAKMMTPEKTATLNTEIDNLEVEKKKQVNQVLEQAEKDFAEKVKQIHENLRVARMTITNREVYEINKKYDDLQKEILDAIQYRYDQEVLMANGDVGKVLIAEKNKADALAKVQDDLAALTVARNEEKNKAIKAGDFRFEEELKNLQLKGEEDVAKGKEKIRDEVNRKYKKLLDDNVKDEEKTKKIKLQMEAEYKEKVLRFTEESLKKQVEIISKAVRDMTSSFSDLNSAYNEYENAQLQKDQNVNDEKKANLKKRLDSGKISQKQYDDQIYKMDTDMDAKKRKLVHDQAVRQKEINVMNAIIATALGVIQATNTAPPLDIIMPIIIGALGVAQIALILSTPVPEAAAGRYNVMGQQDGKTYNDVSYIGKPKTGLYNKPTLMAESGREIVIDNPTTENLMMNYPEVIRAINYARTGAVPQRADGYYPDMGSTGSPGIRMGNLTDSRHTAALEKFNKLIEDGITANVIFDDFRRATKKVDTIESLASKNG